MATRKKKIVDDPANDIPVATDAKAHKKAKSKNVASGGWPKMQQGTHLTVKTFEDGRTELVWDDDQLLKEVREAIASVENRPKASAITGNIKQKKTRAKKSN